ncbi:MAG: PilZ domain-containing protein [Sedimenticola sp.]|nr:PilZ domain-containing protein [Sedimenticola sp.]
MQDYSEKRDFYRMSVDCEASFRVLGSDSVERAVVKDLSAGGVQLRTADEVLPGATLNLAIQPVKAITPPLHAVVTVIRCTPAEDAEGGFAVACGVERMLPAEEAEAAVFP